MASDLFSLDGQVAVITGAARGIGKGAALALAQHGATVVLFDRLKSELLATTTEIQHEGRAVLVEGDITQSEDIERLVAATRTLGPIDILVNCAGVMHRTDIEHSSVTDLDRLWSVNGRGLFAVTQAFIPTMIEHRCGKIIQVGSLGSMVGLERRTAYAMTKGAVRQYTCSLALELGPYGINVNGIAPGYIATEMSKELLTDPERGSKLLDHIPLGRFGRASDLEGAFVFLASHASDYMTGQLLVIDGGWLTL